MATYKTPGVYVEEISTLPPSVAEVATAIPAFIGYTEISSDADQALVHRITTMLEYRQLFGGAPPIRYQAEVATDPDTQANTVTLSKEGNMNRFILYYSLKLYFENGGGPCYIVSIGNYEDSLQVTDFTEKGLPAVALLDEPTLLLFPDATQLDDASVVDGVKGLAYGQVVNQALKQCAMLHDRFTIMDLANPQQTSNDFRSSITSETAELKYGAAYTPYLDTLITYEVKDQHVQINDLRTGEQELEILLPDDRNKNNFLRIGFTASKAGEEVSVEVRQNEDMNAGVPPSFDSESDPLKLLIHTPLADNLPVDDAFFTNWDPKDHKFELSSVRKQQEILLRSQDSPLSLQATTNGVFFGQFPADAQDNVLRIVFTEATADTANPPTVNIATDPNVTTPTVVSNGRTLNITLGTSATSLSALREAIGEDTFGDFTISAQGDGSLPIPDNSPTSLSLQRQTAAETLPNGTTNNFVQFRFRGTLGASPPEIRVTPNSSPIRVSSTDDGNVNINIPGNSIPVESDLITAWNAAALSDFVMEVVRVDEPIILSVDNTAKTLSPVNAGADDQSISLMDLNKEEKGSVDTALYNQIRRQLSKERLRLPASPAMAGIYARIDRTNGVWKTPANVSISGIVGPSQTITHLEQEGLNIDATSGKSINAIRFFTGKGTLVWGGRTLAGNDNEWRYISVRRLFNLIEESVQKSTSFAVFESNDSNTWLKVKAMIDSYLYGLWQQGALAGSLPEQAYFVQVGLGKTMTAQDILEGRMNIEIGLAAVRPAEFIILKFSHKLQEA